MNRYIEISNDLRNCILKDNVYHPNDQLPCGPQLCEEYNVSKMTLKKSLDILVEEGLIYKKRGLGTFVKGLSSREMVNLEEIYNKSNQPLSGFSTQNKMNDVKSKVLEFSIILPTPQIASSLRISEDDFVYKILRVRILDEEPCVVEETYMPIDVIPGLKMVHVETSIYTYIRESLNFEIQSAHVRIRARGASEFIAENLDLQPGNAVAQVEQIAFLDNGMPFEYSISTHKAERYEFSSVIVKKIP